MSEKENVTQEAQDKAKAYHDFIDPISQEIRNAIVKATNDNPDTYSELDVHNALAMTMNYLAARDVPDESRQEVIQQAADISEAMASTGVDLIRGEDAYLISLLLGSIQATLMISKVIESSSTKDEA